MIDIQNPALKKIWEDRYQKNGETIKDNIYRVANYIATNDFEFNDFAEVMLNGYFFPAGRTMSNAGIGKNLTLNNCFVYPVIEDSMEGIFEAVKSGALTHKAGGGIGYEFSLLRPNGSKTSNEAIASGVVSFMDVFNAQTATVMQGSRRGANMGVLSIYHPDIEEYIDSKSKDKNKLNHFNLSIMVDDKFMQAVENKEKIYLHYPVYDEKYHIIEDQTQWKQFKEIDANYLWDKIMRSAYNNGEPGIMFYDNMNRDNNTWYTETITHSNPCFTGDMRLLTVGGYKTFESLVNEYPMIKNCNGKDVKSHVWCSGEKEVLQLTFSNGKKIKCTPNHVFMTTEGEEIKAEGLKNKRIKQYTNIKQTHNKEFVRLGFLQGDGDLGRLKSQAHAGIEVNIGKNDTEIWDLFNIPNNGSNKYYLTGYKNQLISYGFSPNPLPNRTFPSAYDFWEPDEKLSFLRGCYSANGSVITTSRVAYKTTCKEFAIKLMDTLSDFGYSPYMTTNKQKVVQFANGEFICKQSYDINIGRFNDIIRFYEDIGFEQQYKMNSLLNLINKRSPKVIGIKSLGIQKVYDFTEPETHWGVVEGCIVHNCSEYLAGTVFGQELPSNQYAGACNLGSIMLQNLVRHPFTEHAYLDFSELSNTIRVAVKMLDNIIDINNFPLPQYENYQKNFRTIGLGVTGLADALAMLNIKYNSKEAIEYTDNLMELIAIAAYRASIELAKTRGSFPFLDDDKYVQSGYLCKHRSGKYAEEWIRISNDIMQYGIRNARILSIAPTGTLSLTFGNNCSSGIEPIFSLEYNRKVKVGGQNDDDIQEITIRDYAYDCYKLCKQSDVNEDVFVTALNMTVNEHIDMLAAIAKHVDMSVSKTINVPTDYSFEDTKDIYMKCWKAGIKGCTIFRPNEVRQGILSDNTTKKVNNTVAELSRGDWKPKAADTTYYQRKLRIGCGKLFLFIGWSDSEQCIQDFYVTRSGQGGCERLLQAAAISMSAIFRLGGNIDNIEKAFRGIGGCNSFATQRGKGEKLSSGSSCGVAILNELKAFIKERTKHESKPVVPKIEQKTNSEATKMKCPECGKMSLRYEGGCNVCEECGFSSCG